MGHPLQAVSFHAGSGDTSILPYSTTVLDNWLLLSVNNAFELLALYALSRAKCRALGQ